MFVMGVIYFMIMVSLVIMVCVIPIMLMISVTSVMTVPFTIHDGRDNCLVTSMMLTRMTMIFTLMIASRIPNQHYHKIKKIVRDIFAN